MHTRKKTALVSFVLATAHVFVAETRAQERIDDLVAQALANSPELMSLATEVEATRAERQQADYRPNPELSVEGGVKDTDAESGYVVGAEYLQTIERKGKREARQAIADSNVSLAQSALDQGRRDVELRVRTLCYELLIAEADFNAAREVAGRSKALIEMLKERPTAGTLPFLELRAIEASLVEFQASTRDFNAQRAAARIELNSLLGRPADAEMRIAETVEPPARRFDKNALFNDLRTSPQMRMRIIELGRSQLEINAAVLDAKPDYSIGPFLSREDAGEAESTAGLVISLPLAWRNRNVGTIAAARARQVRAEHELASLQRSLEGQLASKLMAYELALEQAQSVPAEIVSNLHQTADLADRQYRLGAIPVQLFLDIQREFLNVQQLRHTSLLEAWRHALELDWLVPSSERNLP
jgi:cobalt-zinc-cadmium efflux system outer membrane protein